jgi:hypothetical protein
MGTPLDPQFLLRHVEIGPSPGKDFTPSCPGERRHRHDFVDGRALKPFTSAVSWSRSKNTTCHQTSAAGWSRIGGGIERCKH